MGLIANHYLEAHTVIKIKIKPFSEWQSAFHIYMAVFIEKFSDQAPHMLKYMEMIKGIRQSKGDEAWKFYDDQFRRLRKLELGLKNFQ
jgi:hypothetical protein